MESTSKSLNIAFVHPDLGIGGAERLVVDSAMALKNSGHQITMYTSHHDKTHCFKETLGIIIFFFFFFFFFFFVHNDL